MAEEYGVSIVETNSADVNKTDYIKIGKEAFSRTSPFLNEVPHYADKIKTKRITADCYKAIYDKGLGQLQHTVKDMDRFILNIVAYGTNNDIVGQGELEKFRMKAASPALAAFDIRSG